MPSLCVQWRTPWTCTRDPTTPAIRRSVWTRSIPNCSARSDRLCQSNQEPQRQDYEYEREGVCNVFVAYKPLAGKRVTQVRWTRTRRDWAEFMREVLDQHYPTAEKVV